MTYAVPLTVSQEANEYIAEHNLQEPFQRMLDHIPEHFAELQAVSVALEYSPCGDEPRLIIDVTREVTVNGYDPADKNWGQWMMEEFPPEQFSHFCLLSNLH